jgi:hypothetical protein
MLNPFVERRRTHAGHGRTPDSNPAQIDGDLDAAPTAIGCTE